MEELYDTSVNTGEVAETQHEEVVEEVIEETQEHSENNSEVAEPKPVQDAETNAHYAEQRRKQELEQYRQQAETYQQQLDRTARLAGYESHEAFVSALDEIERQQERQRYLDQGIDPDVLDAALNERLENHPDILFAKELKQKQEEERMLSDQWTELTNEFPDVQISDIPAEVWAMNQEGKPLLDAYLRYNFKNLAQQKEQEAIKKLQQNQLSSPGSLGQEGSEHKTSYSQLSAKEKANLREKVLRGEATNIL